jgi:hypothetical protein
MEKKGDLLNQFAIISDLLEKINTETESVTIIVELKKDEFKNVFNYFEKKYNKKTDLPEETFTIKLGTIDIIFNMNNV